MLQVSCEGIASVSKGLNSTHKSTFQYQVRNVETDKTARLVLRNFFGGILKSSIPLHIMLGKKHLCVCVCVCVCVYSLISLSRLQF